MSDRLEQDRWLSYISRLNDREINKQQSSGFTTWAVVGFAGYVLFRLVDILPALHTSDQLLHWWLTVTSVFANMGIGSGLVLSALLVHSQPPRAIRFESRLWHLSLPIRGIAICTLLGITLTLNVYSALISPLIGSRWPFIVLGIIFSVQLVVPPVQYLIQRAKFREKCTDLPVLAFDPRLAEKKAILAFAVQGCVLLILSTIPLVAVMEQDAFYENVIAVRASIEVLVFLLLVLLLLGRLMRSSLTSFLLTLERKIVTDDLGSEEIRSLFIVECLGQLVADWLAKLRNRYDQLHSEVTSAVEMAIKGIDKLSDIDSSYKYEIRGRAEEICKPVFDKHEEFSEFVKHSLSSIESLLEKKGFQNDVELLGSITKDWKNKTAGIESAVESLRSRTAALAARAGGSSETE